MKLSLVISSIIAGIIWISVLQFTNNVFTSSGKLTLKDQAVVRTEALVQVISLDLNRIGFGVASNGIIHADSTQITFESDFFNSGTLNTISWQFHKDSENNGYAAIRLIDSTQTDYMEGISEVRFGYLNGNMQKAANINEIRHIELFILNVSSSGYNRISERHGMYRVISPRNILPTTQEQNS
jgi:hypothetical protein